MTAAVWRIQCGEHGWIREIVDGRPIVTAREAEAWQWPTHGEADAALALLPATKVPHRVVPGQAAERAAYFDPTSVDAHRDL